MRPSRAPSPLRYTKGQQGAWRATTGRPGAGKHSVWGRGRGGRRRKDGQGRVCEDYGGKGPRGVREARLPPCIPKLEKLKLSKVGPESSSFIFSYGGFFFFRLCCFLFYLDDLDPSFSFTEFEICHCNYLFFLLSERMSACFPLFCMSFSAPWREGVFWLFVSDHFCYRRIKKKRQPAGGEHEGRVEYTGRVSELIYGATP